MKNPASPAGEAGANLATTKKKRVDASEVQKLKQRANTEKFTRTFYKAFKEEVDAMTRKSRSSRRCYWCLEIMCLQKRISHGKTIKIGAAEKQGNYAEFRTKLDKATQDMCKKVEGIKNRMEQGAEVFQVRITQRKKAGSKKRHYKQMYSKPMSR